MDKISEIKPVSIEELTVLYLKTLDDKTLKTLEIAKDHLGTSFSLKKSIDFLKWKAENEKSTSQAN
jgi:hypothetical protein